MKLLTPTTHRRWNELIGVVWMAFGLLCLLSLVTFSSSDPSLNSASPSAAAQNWAGEIGAFSADLLYQLFGISSLLLPMALLWVGWKWIRSQPFDSPGAKCTGAVLFFASFMAALSLVPMPARIHLAFRPGGVLGLLASEVLLKSLNGPGSAILLVVTILASLYLMTTFSMAETTDRLRPHFAWVGRLRSKWDAWMEARVQRLEAKRVAKQKIRTTGTTSAKVPHIAELPGSELPPIHITNEIYETPPLAVTVNTDPAETPITISLRDEPAKTVVRKPPIPRISQTYRLPSTGLLQPPTGPEPHAAEELKRLAQHLILKCEEFDVRGAVTQINPGPVVTTFEFKPEAGVKYNRITNLTEDLCLGLEAESILIERIPGKSTVGIQVPNARRETIMLREILESEAFTTPHSPLTIALGKEINGRIRVADLASMPHLLIAGSTGSGKSVSMNSLILSILYKATPDEVKMIMVDPKRLELGLYEGVPHLVTPIITDPKVAANALRNGVKEMERRLKLLAEKGVRNIDQYNKLFDRPESLNLFEPQSEHQRLPYIVIFIDELADLMMVDSSNVEVSITRLAQMARAVGIHLVLATQRPSVDVITGLIKANFPARISFRVATKVDSRTILDSNGSEALLGKGDMLFSPPGSGRLVRVHGPLVTEPEIASVVEFWRAQATPSYVEEFLQPPEGEDEEEDDDGWTGERDELYQQAVRIVVEMGKASTSTLQRRLRLGYGRAARLLDIMQKDGIIGPPDGSRPREVLKRPEWFEEFDSAAEPRA
ncbi:MAG: DNA translocase FtsK [Acidobacteria bacterium]|nr:DNA translocase FtsK [Acidobacteriota bacterium]